MIPRRVSRTTALLAHPIAIAGAAATTVLVVDSKREHAVRFGVALPLAIGATKILKYLFPRHKPRLLTVTPNESLPSGHSAATAAFSLALIDARRAWSFTPLALAAVGFVNACRVRDREHRISEVLIGDAIGATAALVAAFVARRVAAHVHSRNANTRAGDHDCACGVLELG